MTPSSASTGRYRIWTADPLNRLRIDHVAELVAQGHDVARDGDFIALVEVVCQALALKPEEAAEHVLRIARERAKR